MRLAIVALFLLVGVATPAFADFQSGVDAVKRGDYATALREFRTLAEQGDTSAQTNLGLMYSKGWGVQPDDAQAAKWYMLAAEKGQPTAQNNLGALYLLGSGVPKDPVLSLVWLTLASENGWAAATAALPQQTATTAPAQVELAKRFVVLWKEKIALLK